MAALGSRLLPRVLVVDGQSGMSVRVWVVGGNWHVCPRVGRWWTLARLSAYESLVDSGTSVQRVGRWWTVARLSSCGSLVDSGTSVLVWVVGGKTSLSAVCSAVPACIIIRLRVSAAVSCTN